MKKITLFLLIIISVHLQAQSKYTPTPDDFVTTWRIEISTKEERTVYMPVRWNQLSSDPNYTYNYTIHWGDGSAPESFNASPISVLPNHEYNERGDYDISITGHIPGLDNSVYPNKNNGQTQANKKKLRGVKQWGTNEWETMNHSFEGCSNLKITATDVPNLSNVTDMSSMFKGATIFNSDLSKWNVGNVKYMSATFYNAASFNQDISNWDVSSVENMSQMFYGASSFNKKIENWDVSSVENMSQMFNGATSFDKSVKGWTLTQDSEKTINMTSMFSGAENFTGIGIDSWNVHRVINMSYMFFKAEKFNGNIGNWDVSSVQLMNNMFARAFSFNQDIGNWKVSNVSNMFKMFYHGTSSKDLKTHYAFDQDLGAWDISSVVAPGMSKMFYGDTLSTSNYDNILIGWNTLDKASGETKIPTDITFDAGNSYYYKGGEAKKNLHDTYNWNITDKGGSGYDKDTFVTTWKTTVPNEKITIPTDNNFTTYDYTVDWGDGSDIEHKSSRASHKYPTTGIHIIKIKGNFPHIFFNNLGDKYKIMTIEQWGKISWESMRGAFYGCKNLISNATDSPDLSKVEDMSNMFNKATKFNRDISGWKVDNVISMKAMFNGATAFNQDISNWKVGKVTNMSYMFEEALSFNQNLNTWDVENVTSMSYMFSKALSFNQDLSNWKVSNVVSMNNMFDKASSFNQDLKNWDVSKVKNMHGMFYEASSFNQDLGNWNISNVRDMSDMFTGIALSTYNYDNILIGWNIKTTGEEKIPKNIPFDGGNSMYCIGKASRASLIAKYNWKINDGGHDKNCKNDSFVTTWETTTNIEKITVPTTGTGYDYKIDWGDGGNPESKTGEAVHEYSIKGIHVVRIKGNFPQIYFNNSGDKDKIRTIEQWGKISWVSMKNAFYGSKNLTSDALDSPDLSKVTDMSSMFREASSFNGKIDSWNVENVTNMSSMFREASSFNGKIDSWNVEKVTDMSSMFREATSFNQDLNSWKVENVTNMSSMFRDATSFNQDLNIWDVENVTNMSSMFSGSIVFNKNLNIWNVSRVTDMSSMFSGAIAFNQDLNSWDVENVTDMNSMFNGATVFNQNISKWRVKNVTNMNSMFNGAIAFNQDISDWEVSKVTDMSNMFNGAIAFNQDISDWEVSKVADMSDMFNGATGFDQDLGNWDIGSITQPGMLDMFAGVKLSTDNYDNILIGWNTKISGEGDVPKSITFNGGKSTYCVGKISRDNLKKTYSWTITDGGVDPDCHNDAFITTWNITGNNEEITIPTDNNLSSYDYVVNWGDGNKQSFKNTNAKHTYAKSSVYTVVITGNFPSIYFNNSISNAVKIKTIEQWGTSKWTSMENAFYGCGNLTSNAIDIPILGSVTNMSNMFRNTPFNGKVTDWDVSKVTDMSNMFNRNTSFAGEGISSWKVGNVTDMTNMFNGATNFNKNLGNWDISKVVHMEGMFAGVKLSTDNYDDTVIGWNKLDKEAGETKIPSNITIDPGKSMYCRGEFAIYSLKNSYIWNFIRNKRDPDCPKYKMGYFNIYPNPTKGIIHFNIPDQLNKIIIYSVVGGNVMTINNNFENIDVSSLKNGVYFVALITKVGTKVVKLIKE